MLKEYRRQAKRFEHLSIYKAIVTHSTYMQAEYIKHGFDPERVHCLSYYAAEVEQRDQHHAQTPDDFSPRPTETALGVDSSETKPGMPDCWRLLFLGRMDFLKGGHLLINALPRVKALLDRPVHVTFAGDGPERKIWEHYAARTQARTQGLEIEFVGWVKGKEREMLWNDCHLLVLSSVWPEPFGLVGPEAGLRGMPTVAFAVGGITDWLKDGINGYLASGDPPTSENLADTIVKCFRDPVVYARLRQGAVEVSRKFKMERHLAALLNVLEKVVQDN